VSICYAPADSSINNANASTVDAPSIPLCWGGLVYAVPSLSSPTPAYRVNAYYWYAYRFLVDCSLTPVLPNISRCAVNDVFLPPVVDLNDFAMHTVASAHTLQVRGRVDTLFMAEHAGCAVNPHPLDSPCDAWRLSWPAVTLFFSWLMTLFCLTAPVSVAFWPATPGLPFLLFTIDDACSTFFACAAARLFPRLLILTT